MIQGSLVSLLWFAPLSYAVTVLVPANYPTIEDAIEGVGQVACQRDRGVGQVACQPDSDTGGTRMMLHRKVLREIHPKGGPPVGKTLSKSIMDIINKQEDQEKANQIDSLSSK